VNTALENFKRDHDSPNKKHIPGNLYTGFYDAYKMILQSNFMTTADFNAAYSFIEDLSRRATFE